MASIRVGLKFGPMVKITMYTASCMFQLTATTSGIITFIMLPFGETSIFSLIINCVQL
ncbi:ORF145 [Alphabaculovirus altermyunipunctae]|uniref:ORF145 n=1 Tax=Mythimna unipuncta nucleopolyhedrovirus TaxID=447897 RepID=A0A346TPT1_9ABAC|nr:ORF145 [Mythimna unipuncta nucleopolyhedrovirus]AXU41591.1 ORF145 [Mythimna unipuncta nucleopolyhedrovirus]